MTASRLWPARDRQALRDHAAAQRQVIDRVQDLEQTRQGVPNALAWAFQRAMTRLPALELALIRHPMPYARRPMPPLPVAA